MADIFTQNPELYLEEANRFLISGPTFHEAYVTSELQAGRITYRHREWGHYVARFARYNLFWAHYENNVYRKVHLFADRLKEIYNLYTYIRSIYSPAYRLVEFWATHIFGGLLDPEAGDGDAVSSALPIITKNEAIRPVIAQIWRDSNWQAKKEIFARFGSAMGDTALMAVDDEEKQKVQFKVVDPRTIVDVVPDSYGNVKAYTIEEWRPDPENANLGGLPIYAKYTEKCIRIGDSIGYATFRNDYPYDWRDYSQDLGDGQRVGSMWTENYDFVPLVFVQNRDMGLGWGFSELQPSISKLNEVDDVASKLDDWIRITTDAPWLLTGMSSANLDLGKQPDEDDSDSGGRETMKTIYSSEPQAKAQALIAPLDVSAVSAHIQTIYDSIAADHPELLADDVGAAASGEARKVAREKVEAMVVQRRSGYDDAIVRAHMMAISIGGIKGYPGFEGFNEASYSSGALEHSIGPREIFAVDSMVKIAEAQGRANVIKTLTDSGVPLEIAMEQAGYTKDEVARAIKAKRMKVKRAMQAKQVADAAALKAAQDAQRLALSDQPVGSGNGSFANPNQGY